MKWSNEELAYKHKDVIATINLAIKELDDVEEYEDIKDMLEEVKDEFGEEAEKYINRYREECKREQNDDNSGYMGGVI